jgi:putative PIG3 family NAD(P)H quinone oxidoreductase
MTNAPRRMRIIDVPVPGGPEALVIAERDVPTAGQGEVLIRVAAAGVNRADILQRLGKYPSPQGAPPFPGLEVSGTVEAVGPGVGEFAPGAAVCALLAGGGYAEYCVAPVEQVLPVPTGVSLVAGAALPEAYFTVWSNVFGYVALKPGESLLVHGGSSGIGSTAIQLAKAFGSPVYATAGSPEKCEFCRSLGASAAFDYRREDFVQAVKAATAGRGVDVILDMVAADYVERNLDALCYEGRLVVIATPRGTKATLDVGKVMGKRLTLTGSTLRPRSVAFKGNIKKQLLERVWPLLARGVLRPVVDREFPFAAAAAAHAYMESSAHMGKILLIP